MRNEEAIPDSNDGSVSRWIVELKDGNSAAADVLWQRYFDRLVKTCSRRLGKASRRVADEEDVAVDVFDSLCRGAAEGRFDHLQGRDDLWSLLVVIAGRKAVSQIRRQTSQKRGGTELRGDSVFFQEGGGFDQFLNAEPTPETLAIVKEKHQRLMSRLRDDGQRQIARLRLQGYSNEEIADQTGISLRSVARKIAVIKAVWSAAAEADD